MNSYACPSAPVPDVVRLVIQALVKASGSLGLEAFLPSHDRVIPGKQVAPEDEEVPHLPLNDNWQDADFDIRTVIHSAGREVNIRDWTLKLLQRYRFVVGTSIVSAVVSPRLYCTLTFSAFYLQGILRTYS